MNNGPEGPRDDSPQESLFDEGVSLPATISILEKTLTTFVSSGLDCLNILQI